MKLFRFCSWLSALGWAALWCLVCYAGHLAGQAQSNRVSSVEVTVEKSTNLIDWKPFAVVTIPDPASLTQAQAFYRIVTNR